MFLMVVRSLVLLPRNLVTLAPKPIFPDAAFHTWPAHGLPTWSCGPMLLRAPVRRAPNASPPSIGDARR